MNKQKNLNQQEIHHLAQQFPATRKGILCECARISQACKIITNTRNMHHIRIFSSILEYLSTNILEYRQIFSSSFEYFRVSLSTLDNLRVSSNILENPQVCSSIFEYPRVSTRILEYPQVSSSIFKYLRVSSSILEYLQVFFSILEYPLSLIHI